MKLEVVTVRRVTLTRDEVEEAIIEHIEAFHDLPGYLQKNCKGILDIPGIRSVVF